MTVNSASVTDDEFAALVKHHGEKTVVAMVQLMAYANFQDRVVLCLGVATRARRSAAAARRRLRAGAF